jgi:ABC-2 type transport system ATP-binding protein
MWEELEWPASSEQLTILLTTHYLEEADRLARRIAIVSRGRVVAEGAPDELKRRLLGDAVTVELADGKSDTAAGVVSSSVPSRRRSSTGGTYGLGCSRARRLSPQFRGRGDRGEGR